MIARLSVLWLFLLPLLAFSQSPPKSTIDLEAFMERLFPVQEEDLDYESIYEVLLQLYLNPIEINLADMEVLQATYLLSPSQINSLIAYRSDVGPLISLYELQAVPEFDLQTLENLMPFVTLGQSNRTGRKFWDRVQSEDQAYILFRHQRTWEVRKGYTPAVTNNDGSQTSRYLGDPNTIYARFRIQHPRDFSMGITLDKDAGEQFTWDGKTARYGFNFMSIHFTRYYVGKWKTIALGDFQASFGQGLVFGAGYALGKGAETVPTVRRSSMGILPYTAAMEFGFFRGIGLTRQMENWQASLVASHAARDGRISVSLDSLDSPSEIISTFNQSGLHRTPSELATKNQFRETNLGANVQYSHSSKKFQIGANSLFTRFDRPWIKAPQIYNRFEFAGQHNFVSSLYANYNWRNFFLFGESAVSQSGGTGTVLGFVSSLSKQVDFSMLWRQYDRNFHSFYASGFAENSRAINEEGIYLGLQIKPEKRWKINAYYDFFKFPWMRYRVYAPSNGYEWLGRISYQPRRNLKAFIQIREEQKDRNSTDSGEPTLPYLVLPIKKLNGMVSLESQLSGNLFIRSRILFSRVDIQQAITHGFMILQDVQFGKDKWRMTGRVALFDADTYDNRLYAFENNVLWTYSIPAFFGQGMRYYVIGQYQVSEKLTAYLRFSRTSYTDRDQISSGLQAIKGSTQTETAFMLRYFLR
jgi:hypothetical protein